MTTHEKIACDLTKRERGVLARGVGEWWGAAAPTEALAVVMGFASLESLETDGNLIAQAILAAEPLTPDDWARALVATEFVFASDFYGAGVEWSILLGFSDEETIQVLRQIQLKLVAIVNQSSFWPRGPRP
jgi:hypothetical protein